jgi:hypothetical protein
MEKTRNFLIKGIIILMNLVTLIIFILLYLNKIILFEIFLALVFLQFLLFGLILFIYVQYKRVHKLARELNFKYMKGTFPHPKFEGTYKKNWWQIHYLSKETGNQWGMPRTYIKLQWKTPKKFDDNKLYKYTNLKHGDSRIIGIKHVIRDYKNYLLLKRPLFTFNKKKIHSLMDLLLKVAKESEIK